MDQDIFRPEGKNREMFERLMRRDPPARQYAVHFTPRSGSSWLTDLAESSGVLGSPRECFNPNFMPEMVSVLGALSMAEYVAVLGRRFQAAGTWGFEITRGQMEFAFGDDRAFMKHFKEARQIWLIREDIVAQAISLQKMNDTGVTHSVHLSDEARAEAEARFVYDAEAIAKWLLHIRRLETGTEAFFAEFGMSPLRLSYEVLMNHHPAEVVRAVASHVGAEAGPDVVAASTHQKVGTPRNLEFAERFRHENAELLADVDADRATMLARLTRDLNGLAVR